MGDTGSVRYAMGTLMFLCLGPLIWAADLTVIYGTQSSLCAFGGPTPLVTMLVIGCSVVAALLTVLVARRPTPVFRVLVGAPAGGEQWPFLQGLMQMLSGLSVLAIAYFAIAAALLPACGALR
jgi:hypothetical protein